MALNTNSMTYEKRTARPYESTDSKRMKNGTNAIKARAPVSNGGNANPSMRPHASASRKSDRRDKFWPFIARRLNGPLSDCGGGSFLTKGEERVFPGKRKPDRIAQE